MKRLMLAPALLFCAVGCLVSIPARADEKRPVESIVFEEIMPEEPGSWDVRMSLEARRKQPEEGESVKPSLYALPRAQLFFGIFDGLGGEIGIPLLLRDPKKGPAAADGDEASAEVPQGEGTNAGLGDASLGLKYLFLEERENRPAMVAMFELGLPTGDKERGLGEEKTEYAGSLGWVKGFPSLTAQGTVGYSVSNKEVEKTLLYNLSLATPLMKSGHLFAEMTGERDLRKNINRVSLGPGLKYDLSSGLFVALGIPLGVTPQADDYRIVTQAQYGFGAPKK